METISRMALDEGHEPAAILAVAQIESGGRAGALVAGRLEPLIRFEGHYFDRRLSPADRKLARRAGIADPRAGAVANPRRQDERWALLRRAARIDRRAAYESVSWGVGQVMGAHWAWLGYASVDALAAEARSGLPGQVRLMLRYIRKAGLGAALRERDWRAFARGYNGPAFARRGYHRKLARAFRAYAAGPAGALGEGARGPRVDDLQILLGAAGYPVAVDGLYGPRTRAALARFQAAAGLTASGRADPETMAALRRALPLGALAAALGRRLARLFRRLSVRRP